MLHKRVFFGAYLLITLTFSCQHDQLVGVYSDRLKNRGLRHGSGQKRGVLGTGQARKKGGLRHGSGQKRGVFTAAHTCTGHICECPPPPRAGRICGLACLERALNAFNIMGMCD